MTYMVQLFHGTRILIIPQNELTAYSLHNINDLLSLVFVENTEKYTHNSKALTDFVYESNHEKACWFIANHVELEHKLKAELKNSFK
ncbi:DUF4180 domain-containing protein [Acinetobacter nematophilus]|uniref:DUF4180 domain-containing protein n=1 Tax=Acinetobacter nematophilus TaxID=2994642 RepID=UPI003AF9D8A5